MKAMFKRFWFAVAAVFLSAPLYAADLSYYLPDNVEYDSSVPTPYDVLGWNPGEWHVGHTQLVRYMEVIAEHSDRFQLEYTGRSHEQRPMMVLKVSAPENMGRLEEMREQHMAITDPSQNVDATEAPLVLYMGYSIHGDEPSGSNAALILAYYLAAAQGPEVDDLLANTVILLDPSYNPDGLNRFAQWANQFKSMNMNSDRQHIEHQQGWMRGRQNHYWFDLNRDWLLVQHPESRARIATYQRWLPNVLTDHHEMGTDSTYFFQPGIPSRKNPLTPEGNVRLTEVLAEYHAEYLDEIHSLYYTEESFDDFYYGKGSSYPDAQGTIGILFEQASSRGHLQESINGDVSFPFTIKNQFVTSLSTIWGSHEVRDDLLTFQQQFFKESMELAAAENFDGYMLRESTDEARMAELLNVLKQHNIEAYPVTEEFSAGGETYRPGEAYFVPIRQKQYRLLKGSFTTRKDFPDNTFYDVSTWTLPMAFNVEFEEVRTTRRFRVGDNPWTELDAFEPNQLADTNVGYAFGWDSYFAPRVLSHLLQNDVHARLATDEMTISTPNGEQTFERGTVLVTRAYQDKDWGDVQSLLNELADENRIRVHTIASGLTPSTGMDIGSRSIDPVNFPNVMIVIGPGTHFQETGEAWYYLDRHVNLPVTLIETSRLDRVDLDRYSHIIMLNGNYNSLNDNISRTLRQWVRSGGTMIGQKGGARWMSENNILGADVVSQDTFREQFPTEGLSYGDRNDFFAKQRIAGAIFNVDIDLSHPLAVGYPREQLPVFKDSTMAFEVNDAPFVDVARYAQEPLLSGYTSEENQSVLAGKSAVVAHRLGSGRVVGFADNVNFRGFFWGTSKLMSNAIFWSQYVMGTAADDEEAYEEVDDAHAH